jgi:D-glycero-beta-D-manno-heptose-7-phosphate kinase
MDIQPQTKYSILLIGDDCVDQYQLGTVDRISPEAPVPIFKPSGVETRAGMAGNVHDNLRALDCDVLYLHKETSVKTRIVDVKSNYQLLRIDEDEFSEPFELMDIPQQYYDAVVISDYNKGTVSYELVEEIRKHFEGPIFIDTKKTDLERFEGCYVKVNDLEHSLLKTYCTDLIITHGKNGATYKDKHYPAPSVEVSDVTGAGDTFLSAMVVEFLNTNDIDKALQYAIKASSVTVQHAGVYAPTKEEIK